jgi:phasin family protein
MFIFVAPQGLFKAALFGAAVSEAVKAGGAYGLTTATGSARSWEGIIMTGEEMQKLGKDSMEMAMSSFGAWNKSAQAIVVEIVDYSKKSIEGSAVAWEKLLGAKSLEKAMEVQSDYLKTAYEDFVAETTKLGELYVDFAKEAYKPFEGAMAKASAMK